MSNPADGGHETFYSESDEAHAVAPDDNETAALSADRGDQHSLDLGDIDTEALTTEAGLSGHADDAYTKGVLEPSVERVAIPKQSASDRVHYGSAAFVTEVETVAEEDDTVADDDREVDLNFDEKKDFDPRTPDDVRAPTDPVEAYKVSMHGDILPHEQVIEKAKDVEAGKTAEWILRINEVVDNDDPDSLLALRQAYIEARQANMRLEKKDDAEDAGDETEGNGGNGEPNEVENQAQDTGKQFSKKRQATEAAEQAKEEKRAVAETEVDDLIALALRYREPTAEPGRTMLPENLRQDLAEVVSQGTKAKDAMIGSIELWTFNQAMKYVPRGARVGMSASDVIQEGNLGAIRAIEKYDWTKGYKLTTYSTWWIKQSITRAIQNGDLVRKPTYISVEIVRARAAEARLRANLQPGEELTDNDIAAAAKMTPKRLNELRQLDLTPASLDKPIGDGGRDDTLMGDLYRDERVVALEAQVSERDRQAQIRDLIDEALTLVSVDGRGNPDPRVAKIIMDRFGVSEGLDGQPRTLDAIASEMGITRERVRQLENKGRQRMLADPELAARVRALLS